jgi:hypothetical protein
MDGRLDLTIWREVLTVSVVRRFIEELYEQVFVDQDVVSRIAMVAHELLENAIKYSERGQARIQIAIEPIATGRRVSIRVDNTAVPDRLGALRAAIGEINAAIDPLLHYQALLRRSAKRRDGSGLGLARVVAEGEMALALAIEGDMVSLRAQLETEEVVS